MRTRNLFIYALLSVIPAIASGQNPELIFVDDSQIELRRFPSTLAGPDRNACDSAGACRDRYFLRYEGIVEPAPQVPEVTRVQVDTDQGRLLIHLSEPLRLTQGGKDYALKDFELVLRRVVTGDAELKPGNLKLALMPALQADPVGRDTILYRSFRRMNDAPDDGKVKVTVKEKETGRTVETRVVDAKSAVQTESAIGYVLWRLELEPPLGRGKTWSVEVSGIDSYDGKAVSASGEITPTAFPKGRDDAVVYISGQKVYNQLGDDQGSVDFKLQKTINDTNEARDWWYLISATVGSPSLGLSQTGTASVGHRWWLGVDGDLTRPPAWAISAAPTFRTDRDFHNRDLGLDLALEWYPPAAYKTIEARRLNPGSRKPEDIKYGWWLKPKFLVEGGRHLASSSEEVEDETFFRGVLAVNLLLERGEIFTLFDRLALTIDFAARHLERDEVILDVVEDQPTVLKIGHGYKPYLRAELSYGIGPVALSVIHENGKLPPAFKTARATTAGVTFKF